MSLSCLKNVKRNGTNKRPEPPSKTYAVYVIDRSGSMTPCKNSLIQGYNTFLEEQNNTDSSENLFLTTILFNGSFKIKGDPHTPIDKVEYAKSNEFYCGGRTALYDSVGKAIELLEEIQETNTNPYDKYMIIIMTDGFDNSSKKYSKYDIKSKVKKHSDWSITFLAANQDAKHVGSQMGINESSCADFIPNPLGLTSLSRAISNTVTRFRSGELPQLTADDLKTLKIG